MLKRNIAILIGGAMLAGSASLAMAQAGPYPQGSVGDQGTVALLPAQIKYFEQLAASNPNPTGSRVRIFAPTSSALAGTQALGAVPGGNPGQAKYFAEREAGIRAERGPWVSVFDDCKMHSHGDAGFHS